MEVAAGATCVFFNTSPYFTCFLLNAVDNMRHRLQSELYIYIYKKTTAEIYMFVFTDDSLAPITRAALRDATTL